MSKVLETYIFTGFGFDVLLKNVVMKKAQGEEYPDINMNELKLLTAKALLRNQQQLTGHQLKFLRTFVQMSFDDVSKKIHTAASTLRSWENKGDEFTGLGLDQEKAFRIMMINKILENERSYFDINLTLTTEFSSPKKLEALDIAANLDFSFVSNG
jgi:DNA-binding transcriptional regulator YiaG